MTFLYAMGLFWPNRKYRIPIAHTLSLTLFLVSIMCFVTQAQPAGNGGAANGQIRPLQIGDPLPDELWDLSLQVVNHPQGKETITLNEYKDKLIILDFWATWCGPCIKSLDKLDSLQKEFGEDLVILPITGEEVEQALAFIRNKGWSLPSVIEKEILKGYFPFKSIPQQVWINQGKIIGFPQSEYANSDNIVALMNGSTPPMVMKIENVSFDPFTYLEVQQNDFAYSGFDKRKDVESAGLRIAPNGLVHYNVTLPQLLREAFTRTHPFVSDPKRILFNIPDELKSKIISPFDRFTGDYEEDMRFIEWRDSYTYIYYSRYNIPVSRDEVYNKMQADITSFFGVYLGLDFSIENRKLMCWTIRSIDINAKSNPTSYSHSVENIPFQSFVNHLRRQNEDNEIPIVDFTDYKGRVTFYLNAPLNDLHQLGKELTNFGFQLAQEEVSIPFLVISDKLNNQIK